MALPSPGDIPLLEFTYLTDGDPVNKIDGEIARLKARIECLRSLRNSLLPISRLPPEILSKVFLLCVKKGLKGRRTRLIISWVSQHWRSVALGCPALWSSIDISHPDQPQSPPSMIEYVQECLIRSRQTPLNVTYYGLHSEILDICGSQMHRIRRLLLCHCSNHRGGDRTIVLSAEWGPAPLLLDLELDQIQVEEGVFGGVNPPLRSIKLSSCGLSWNVPFPSTLTRLEIDQPEEYIAPEVLASKLQAMPALKTCILNRCFDEWIGPAAAIGSTASLPNLGYLSVVDFDLEMIADFLQRIEIPNTSLKVVLQAEELDKSGLQERFQWFAEYQGRVWKNLSNLYIQHNITSGSDAVDGFTVTADSEATRRFTFSIEQGFDPFDFGDPFLSAIPYLPLENTPYLYIDEVTVQSLNAFKPFPVVKALELTHVGPDFLEWAVSSSKKIFPSVTDLNIGDVSYSGFKDYIDADKKRL